MIIGREKLVHSEKYLSQCHFTHYEYHVNNFEIGSKFLSVKMTTHPVSGVIWFWEPYMLEKSRTHII
jgi:hypothetical protein